MGKQIKLTHKKSCVPNGRKFKANRNFTPNVLSPQNWSCFKAITHFQAIIPSNFGLNY
jgi:hypothetical protein